MEIFLGFVLCLVIEGIVWATVWFWRTAMQATVPSRPTNPLSAAQRANRAAFDEEQAASPRVASFRVQRRVRRGRRLVNKEKEYNPLD